MRSVASVKNGFSLAVLYLQYAYICYSSCVSFHCQQMPALASSVCNPLLHKTVVSGSGTAHFLLERKLLNRFPLWSEVRVRVSGPLINKNKA